MMFVCGRSVRIRMHMLDCLSEKGTLWLTIAHIHKQVQNFNGAFFTTIRNGAFTTKRKT